MGGVGGGGGGGLGEDEERVGGGGVVSALRLSQSAIHRATASRLFLPLV